MIHTICNIWYIIVSTQCTRQDFYTIYNREFIAHFHTGLAEQLHVLEQFDKEMKEGCVTDLDPRQKLFYTLCVMASPSKEAYVPEQTVIRAAKRTRVIDGEYARLQDGDQIIQSLTERGFLEQGGCMMRAFAMAQSYSTAIATDAVTSEDGKMVLMSGRRLARKLPAWLADARVPPNQAILVSGQPVCQGSGRNIPEYVPREHCGVVPLEPQWRNQNAEVPPGCDASIANFLVYMCDCRAIAKRSQWGKVASTIVKFQKGQIVLGGNNERLQRASYDRERYLLSHVFGMAQDTTPMARPTTAWTLALVSGLADGAQTGRQALQEGSVVDQHGCQVTLASAGDDAATAVTPAIGLKSLDALFCFLSLEPKPGCHKALVL